MKKRELLLLIIILFAACIVRLYRFDSPVADWHAWRQADTSSVSRIFAEQGLDLLRPRYHDLSSIPSNLDNPNGYRFVEFPLYNFTQALFYKIFGYFTLEQWGRLVTIAASLLSTVFLYLIISKYTTRFVGLLAAFFFAFLPFNIYYGRTILPDAAAVSAMLGGIYFFDKWLEGFRGQSSEVRGQNKLKHWIFFILSIIFTAEALLFKPFMLFFTLPIIYLAFQKFGLAFVKKWQLWLFLILSILPLLLWRLWMQQFPEGIPQNSWLFNGNNIRFKGAFFYWIFAERIGRLILGYWGLALLVLGAASNTFRSSRGFLYSFIASSLLYLVVVATGNVQHDYYQILIIPTLSIFLALGSALLLSPSADEFFNKYAARGLFALSTLFMVLFSWYYVRDYYNIFHPEIVEAGKVIDEFTPKDAKVIADYEGDTTFLYQTKRQGWPVFDRPLEDMIKGGAQILAFVNPTPEELNFANMYKTLKQTDTYVIFDLRTPLTPKKL